VTRRRDPGNRRMHLVELTPAGEAAFQRMRGTVMAFDRQLRSGLNERELALVEQVLQQLRANVTTGSRILDVLEESMPTVP
jgi:MarR family transcriptional regulator for hemolysin